MAIPVVLALLWWSRSNSPLGSWAKVIDPRWLPFMLASKEYQQRRQWPWAVAVVIAALALSGPTWQQLPQPLHKTQAALVVLLDLSPSMQAQDLKPDRITRARHKLRDILQQRKEGQTALVVYGGSAHVVTPLTDDTATIVSQLSVLHPNLINTPGSNIEQAMALAEQLLANSGYNSGDLLLITDGIEQDAAKNLRQQLRGQSLRLSILGLGTTGGAPIPMTAGGFAKDRSGNIVVAKLERQPLLQLTRRHNGQYTDLTADDRDLQLLQGVFDTPIDNPLGQQGRQLERTFDDWRDRGYWLALLLLPAMILAFRRGLLACLLVAPMLVSEPLRAAGKKPHQNAVQRLVQNAFQTRDQQGRQAFQQQQFQRAQQAFENSNWKGSAAYRNGDFEAALAEFEKDSSATGLYNQGNALAQLGKLDQAIDAYRQALQQNPDFEDAAANKKTVEELKKQQQSQQNSPGGDQQQSDRDPNSDRQKPGDQQSQQDSQEGSQQDSQQGSEQDAQQNPQQPDGEQQSRPDQGQQTDQQQNSGDSSRQDQSQQNQSQQNQSRQQSAGQPGDREQSPQQAAQQAQAADTEKEQADRAMEQFLRKVPDNPGAFLREKFRHQQRQSQRQNPSQRKTSPQRW